MTLRALLKEITHSPDRSTLFWWLVDHHDEMVEASAGRRLQWARLCTRFAELGLTDVRGQSATERTARATWEKARREVTIARERAAAQAKQVPRGGGFPSRMSPDRRPDLGLRLPPPSAARAPIAGVVSAVHPAGKYDDLPPHAKAEAEKLDALFAEIDRKKFGI